MGNQCHQHRASSAKPVADTLVAKINLALEPFGETLRTSKGREIGERGRYYTVDYIGRVVQADVCLTGLAVELGVIPRRALEPGRDDHPRLASAAVVPPPTSIQTH